MIINYYYYFLTLKILRLINNNKWRKVLLMLLYTHNVLLMKEFDYHSFYYLLKSLKLCFIKSTILFYSLFYLRYNSYWKFNFLISYNLKLFVNIYLFSLYDYFQIFFDKKKSCLQFTTFIEYRNNRISFIQFFYFVSLLFQFIFFFNKIFYFLKNKYYLIQLSDFSSINLYFFGIDLNLLFSYTIKTLEKDLFSICKKSYGHSTSWFIRQINYIILKWFYKWKYYFLLNKLKKVNVNKIIFSLDTWIFNKQFHYINRNNSKKSLLWKIKTYFGPFNPYQKDFWVFGDTYSSIYLIKVLWINNF